MPRTVCPLNAKCLKQAFGKCQMTVSVWLRSLLNACGVTILGC